MNATTPNLLTLQVTKLEPGATIPTQASEHDAGYDLYCLGGETVGAYQRVLLRTGIAVAIPPGHVGYIKPRSGLALRHGIDVLGGVIDSGYRGEVGVILFNTSSMQKRFDHGDRIAQLVIQPVTSVDVRLVGVLPGSERGAGGFGSTGA